MSNRLTVREILAVPSKAVFAVRARVVPFPEGVLAAWVMLAAKGRI